MIETGNLADSSHAKYKHGFHEASHKYNKFLIEIDII